MTKAKAVKLNLKSHQSHLDGDAILASVERDRGVDAAVHTASHLLDAATDYLIQKRGAEYMLDQFLACALWTRSAMK